MNQGSYKFGAVALIGPPNAGKSTLLNTLVGQKLAIVTPKPQTTRNRISGILTTDEAQVVFLDTPGVHRVRGRMNRFLLDSALAALASADMVVVILDADLYAAKPHLFDREIAPLREPVEQAGTELIIAANKIDRIKDKRRMLGVLQKIAGVWPEAEVFPLSALKGEGVDGLLAAILDRLPSGPPMFPEDQVSTLPVRFMAAEIIREKLFMALRQELPYSTHVEIEAWEEEGRLTRINACIYTAKKSHKGIIIGKGGQTLREVGKQARLEIEEMLDGRVFLDLWVKVKEGWTEDPGFLRTVGLGE